MHSPTGDQRGGPAGPPLAAPAGGVLLSGAAGSTLALAGTTYPCPGPLACARVVMLAPFQRWLLAGVVLGSLAFAVAARRGGRARFTTAGAGVLAVAATGLVAFWLTVHGGSLGTPGVQGSVAAAVGAAVLLAAAASRRLPAPAVREGTRPD